MAVLTAVPDVRGPASVAEAAAPDVVASVFHGAAVSDSLALLVVESAAHGPRVRWANAGAVELLGHGLEDLRGMPVEDLVCSLTGSELSLLLRRERAVRTVLPVRTAAGVVVEMHVSTAPVPGGRTWNLRLSAAADPHERELRATAAAMERRFATLAERSPVPTLLSEQGMRLAHVNDSFCRLVGRPAEELLGTGWLTTLHPDDADAVVERAVAALEGGESEEAQVRLLRSDGSTRTAVARFAHLVTPGVGAGFVGTIEDITERIAFEAALAHQASHDPLTGLPNRTRLAQHVAERFRPGVGGLACLFLDLDDFKVVNDSLGHAAGDELLVEVAARLRATVRPADLVARFGGDEFVVVCSDVDEDSAVALAERITEVLSRPVRLAGVEVRPHASIGVTVQTADHVTAEELVRDCDIAMYQAKTGGKARVSLLDQRGRAAAHDRLRLVTDLRDAVESGAIDVVYQPVVRTADGALESVEALARWRHPRRGPISPGVFVPLAEETGLVTALGLLVLDRTCEQLAAWDAELGAVAPRRANVNVSALQLDDRLPGHVAAALARHGLTSDRLTVEITESALMQDPLAARQVLEAVRDLGVTVAIDDFGTGYSSLAYLRHLPVACLKVDRSFVAELAAGHAEIATAVIALAGSLGLQTVAEGVEDDAQAAALTALGATALQGFGLARPMSGDGVAAWCASRAVR
jgi:diguanylate cyclase (GGDEF)-like protein/PAS domain S-box-containing protein